MYGDPEVMRRRADQLREQAVDVRALADQLVAGIEGTGWSGRAAEAMRLRVTDRAAHLRAAAGRHESAAEALDGHLHEVESAQEAIATAEQRTTDLVGEARTRVAAARTATDDAGSAGTLGAPAAGLRSDDETLLAFEPPPSGHRDWLSIDLPVRFDGEAL